MKTGIKTLLGVALASTVSTAALAQEITIATVNNGHMLAMQNLVPEYLEENPNITINWVTLQEGDLRSRVTNDITSGEGNYDIMTIGMYEAPIWGERGWLEPLNFSADYDVPDLLPAMRDGLSHDGQLYAAPFYGESSMIMYRRDIVEGAGYRLRDNPTWDEIREIAAAVTDRDNGKYGICLRGKPGWGDNMAIITTIANSHGAQLFNQDWTPAFDSPEWQNAIETYVDLLTNYGPPDSTGNSFNEILALMNSGACAMWIDATIAASFVTKPGASPHAGNIAFAQSPVATTQKGANWLWAWALAVPSSSRHPEEARDFVEWATSRQYIELVGNTLGWNSVPTGTRQSTYEDARFRAAATFDEAELLAIQSADPTDSTLNPSPYVGVQFAAIPEFAEIGGIVGQNMTLALAGELTIEEALSKSQEAADAKMREAGYY